MHRDPDSDNRRGPRLPTTGPREVLQCWRCAEDRRQLRTYRIVAEQTTFGIVLLCGHCVTQMPLDPDPLDATEAA